MKTKTVIYGMLEEEKQRNKLMQAKSIEEIGALPKGSVQRRVLSGHEYYYLKYRENGKVKQVYLTKDPEKAEEVKKLIEKRKYLEERLKRLILGYKQISKIVKE